MDNINTPIATAEIQLKLNTNNFKPALQKALKDNTLNVNTKKAEQDLQRFGNNVNRNLQLTPTMNDIKLRQNAMRVQNAYMKVAGEVRNAFAAVGAVGIGAGKSAIGAFLKSDSAEATKLRYKILGLEDAWAGVGSKLNQVNIGGKSIGEWVDKLTKGLNGLSIEKIEKLAKVAVFSTAIAGGIQFLRILEGIMDTFERIGILKDRALYIQNKGLGGLSGLGNAGNAESAIGGALAGSIAGNIAGSLRGMYQKRKSTIGAKGANTGDFFTDALLNNQNLTGSSDRYPNLGKNVNMGGKGLFDATIMNERNFYRNNIGTAISYKEPAWAKATKIAGTMQGQMAVPYNQISQFNNSPMNKMYDGMNKALSNIVPTLNTFRSKISEVSSAIMGFTSKLGSVLMNVGGVALAGYGGWNAGKAIRDIVKDDGESYGESVDRAFQGDSTSMAANIISKVSLGGYFLSGLFNNKDVSTLKNKEVPNKEQVLQDMLEKEAFNANFSAKQGLKDYNTKMNKSGINSWGTPFTSGYNGPETQMNAIYNAQSKNEERMSKLDPKSKQYGYWEKENASYNEQLAKLSEQRNLKERMQGSSSLKRFEEFEQKNKLAAKEPTIAESKPFTLDMAKNIGGLKSIYEQSMKSKEKMAPGSLQYKLEEDYQDSIKTLMDSMGNAIHSVAERIANKAVQMATYKREHEEAIDNAQKDYQKELTKSDEKYVKALTKEINSYKPLTGIQKELKRDIENATKKGDVKALKELGKNAFQEDLDRLSSVQQGSFSNVSATDLPNFMASQTRSIDVANIAGQLGGDKENKEEMKKSFDELLAKIVEKWDTFNAHLDDIATETKRTSESLVTLTQAP